MGSTVPATPAKPPKFLGGLGRDWASMQQTLGAVGDLETELETASGALIVGIDP
jgi:hypothetical protein